MELDQKEDARADLNKATEIVPKDHRERYTLARLLAFPTGELCHFKRARELVEEAVKNTPKNGNAWESLGMALYRAKDWSRSAEALNKSIELSPHPAARSYLFLSMVQWQLGHNDQARRWYQQAVKRLEKRGHTSYLTRHIQSEAAELLGAKEPSGDSG